MAAKKKAKKRAKKAKKHAKKSKARASHKGHIPLGILEHRLQKLARTVESRRKSGG